MDEFRVDVASLRGLAGRLRSGADELGGSLDELSGATSGQLGTPSLDTACQDFQQRWRYGLSLIRDNVVKVGTCLNATASTYDQHEKDTAQVFSHLFNPEGREHHDPRG